MIANAATISSRGRSHFGCLLLLATAVMVAPISAATPAAQRSPDAPRDEIENILVRGVRTGALERDATVFTDSIDLRERVCGGVPV